MENKTLKQSTKFNNNSDDLLHYLSPMPRHDEPESFFVDGGSVTSKFNVMEGKSVSETLFIRNYKFWGMYGEVLFDRKYYTEMVNSPDHLIFITGLIQTQRFIYAFLCHHFKVDYVPDGPEQFKIWPHSVSIKMPSLIEKKEGLVQKILFEDVEIRSKRIIINARSRYDNSAEAESKLVCYDIRRK